MKNSESQSDDCSAGIGPQPEVLRALSVLASLSTQEDWTVFMERLSVRAARLVTGYNWKGGFRPDSSGPNDPPGKQFNTLAKRWNQVALDGYGKVVDGSWSWDPTKGRSSYWRSEYPNWLPEMVSLFGFLWERLERHVENLWNLDSYCNEVPPSSADDEESAAADADKAVSSFWDKESQELDHTVGDFSDSFEFRPDEALALQENWDEVLAKISSADYEDKDLLRKIAEICKTERMSGEDWEGRRKRSGYVQKKGARPRELVEEIFGRKFDELVENDPLRTRISKAKRRLQEILVSVGVQRCIEAGLPEFEIIYRHVHEEVSDDALVEEITASLAGKMKKDPAVILRLLKTFAEHWIHWFERHRYFEDPGLPGPSDFNH
jgi:hypothetical protein